VGWQRAGDFGFVAEDGASAVGAVWARQFAPAENPAFFIDWRTPEISIAVAAQVRGRGVGAMLLDAMIAEAARRGLDLTLNVRHDNPARRLYGRKGFQVIPGAEVPNRVGGTSLAMLLRTAH
jgi:ribosomal protein S18 acetylase RimI-like enzyme